VAWECAAHSRATSGRGGGAGCRGSGAGVREAARPWGGRGRPAGGGRRARQVGPTCRWMRERGVERAGGQMGQEGFVGRCDKKKEIVVGPRGRKKVGFVFFLFPFFLFFSFLFFQILFKSFSNLFKFKSFTCFQIQILTQISPTILKAFHKLFLTTFQTCFKFKLSFLIQTFTTIFTIIFKDFFTKNFFKTFRITPQSKLMHFNMMHKHLFDSNY
jgi:hypothetical protein